MEMHFNTVQYNSNINYSLKKGYFLSAPRGTEHDHAHKRAIQCKVIIL